MIRTNATSEIEIDSIDVVDKFRNLTNTGIGIGIIFADRFDKSRVSPEGEGRAG